MWTWKSANNIWSCICKIMHRKCHLITSLLIIMQQNKSWLVKSYSVFQSVRFGKQVDVDSLQIVQLSSFVPKTPNNIHLEYILALSLPKQKEKKGFKSMGERERSSSSVRWKQKHKELLPCISGVCLSQACCNKWYIQSSMHSSGKKKINSKSILIRTMTDANLCYFLEQWEMKTCN